MKHLICTALIAWSSILFLGSGQALAEDAPSPKKGWDFSMLAQTPIQSGGRIKPLDTYARELKIFIVGERFWDSWGAMDLILSWMVSPQAWDSREFIQINDAEVKRQLNLPEGRRRFSPKELLRDSYLAQYAGEVAGKGSTVKAPGSVTANDMRESPREKEMKLLVQRVGVYRGIVAGQALLVIPQEGAAPWLSLASPGPDGDDVRALYRDAVIAYRDGKKEEFEESSRKLAALMKTKLETMRLPETVSSAQSLESSMRAEYLYNTIHPFMYAWVIYLFAGILWLWASNRKFKIAASIVTIGGVSLHLLGIVLRSIIAGRPPVTNMYESVIWVGFGIFIFAALLYRTSKQHLVFTVATFLAAFTMLAADSAPAVLDPGIHPLVPVLRSNLWLTVHVLTITISYSAFALSFGISNYALWNLAKKNQDAKKIAGINMLTYRSMQFGVVLLAAGTILGGVWADYSWGRFWGWDPKEVWALIALLSYLALLHARFTGWVGQFAYAQWSVICFLTVVMAWYGVNFVLGVGLHSYGFSTGGRGWVGAFALLQIAYCLVCWGLHKRAKGSLTT